MILILFLLAIGTLAHHHDELHDFTVFHKFYNKSYTPESQEYEMRKTIFNMRVKEFLRHNADPSNSWKKDVNNFADWTEAELETLFGLKSSLLIPDADAGIIELDQPLADQLNWCDKGACTPVKNQGSCGSCWSFAGTESIESDIFVETGKLPVLSPQEFVDCAPNPDHCGGTGGCEGSTADLLFQYAAGTGIASESDYRYTGRDGSCKIKTTKITATIDNFIKVTSNNDSALMAAVNKQPIAVNVAAMSWSFYHSGIVDFNSNNLDLDHVVQLVGYGTENGKNYWLVRNSWGSSWGLKGFIKLARSTECGTDKNNQDGVGCKDDPKQVTVCGVNGILYAASYPRGGKLA